MACPNVESKLLLPFRLTLPSAEEVGQGSDDDDVDDGDLGVGGHDYAGQNAMFLPIRPRNSRNCQSQLSIRLDWERRRGPCRDSRTGSEMSGK